MASTQVAQRVCRIEPAPVGEIEHDDVVDEVRQGGVGLRRDAHGARRWGEESSCPQNLTRSARARDAHCEVGVSRRDLRSGESPGHARPRRLPGDGPCSSYVQRSPTADHRHAGPRWRQHGGLLDRHGHGRGPQVRPGWSILGSGVAHNREATRLSIRKQHSFCSYLSEALETIQCHELGPLLSCRWWTTPGSYSGWSQARCGVEPPPPRPQRLRRRSRPVATVEELGRRPSRPRPRPRRRPGTPAPQGPPGRGRRRRPRRDSGTKVVYRLQ